VKPAGRTCCWLVGAVMSVALSSTARASFTAKDGQILGRTLSYVGNGMSGLAVVGIVFAPANPASRHEAEVIQGIIGDGLVTGKIRLQARLVAVEDVAGITGIHALYVTSGLSGNMTAVLSAAQHLRVPTVSTDPACVLSGDCVVGIASEPTVQIILNQGAAERIGIHFLQAFRMLVKEK
jgi:hypothetical protein